MTMSTTTTNATINFYSNSTTATGTTTGLTFSNGGQYYIDPGMSSAMKSLLQIDYTKLTAPQKNAMIGLLDSAGYDVEQFMYDAGDLQMVASPRNFNKFINASDLLEEFIKWVGAEGVRQGEVMTLPVEFFIKWLVIRACEEDDEEPNVELPALPAPKITPKCLGCGKFMVMIGPVPLHTPCGVLYFKVRQEIDDIIAIAEGVPA